MGELILLIGGLVPVYIFFGGIFFLRYKGAWCKATVSPQICWCVGSGNKAISRGWVKMNRFDVWIKPLGI